MMTLRMTSVSQLPFLLLAPVLRKPLPDGTNHLPKPVKVKQAQCSVGTDVQSSQPAW
jgi:hypothetical protein